MEHRWGERYSVDVSVRLLTGSRETSVARITNASLSGAFVCGDVQLPVFSYVTVELQADYITRKRAKRVAAYVVREAPDGMGLEWCEFAPPAVAALLADRLAAPQREPPLTPRERAATAPPTR